MSTFLFDEIIFGPVKSRRLGVSLGINLLPPTRKICNFNCIYCECGWSRQSEYKISELPSRKDVYEALDHRLSDMKNQDLKPDVITYAGNGEPTIHPDFPGIIDDSIYLRNKYFPDARIAVLSNATRISDNSIREALLKADQNILKLDSAIDTTIYLHNQPSAKTDTQELIRNLADFNGKVIIQTLFLRGKYNGKLIDNTSSEELQAWIKAIELIRPSEVMIYTISRDTPPEGGELHKVPAHELRQIARMVENIGIRTQVSS